MTFEGEVIYWRGPSPWHYVEVPPELCDHLAAGASHVSYGWGVIPVRSRIGQTTWTTSIFPKQGRYLVPLKTAVRDAEGLELGDAVTIHLHIDT